MGDWRDIAARVLQRANELAEYVEARPLERVNWTPPQLAYLSSPAPRKLLRAGNQLGKTWAGLADVIWRATGQHPYVFVRPPPIEIWVICTSWQQSVAIMQKFWDLVPKAAIRPINFSPRWGFGKENPTVVFVNGSIVRFRTTNQGAEALAGATVDFVLIDEPTDEDIYRELDRRLLRRSGQLGCTLTPINRPVEYMRELVRHGIVCDIHARMTVENLTPVGTRFPLTELDGTPMDQAWIDRQWKMVLPRYAPVILDGEWECRVEGAVFQAFDSGVHITGKVPDADLKICMGFDHGQKDFKEVTLLAGIDDSGEYPKVHVLGEYVGDGDTLPDQDAKESLALLREWGWSWNQIQHAYGDKPYDGAGKRSRIIRKSNADLQAAIEKILRRNGELKPKVPLSPPIRQAKKGKGGGAGSVDWGCVWLHRAMLRPGHFTVHPRCERLIESLQKWDYTDNDFKDSIDALRYSTWAYAMHGQKRLRDSPSIYLYGRSA